MSFVNAKVLVVDDDPGISGLLAMLLENAGFEVYEAASRSQAIERLQSSKVDAVVLDMGMPPNEHLPDEGLAVLDWLALYHPEVKTLVLTGQHPDSTAYLAIKHGAFDFLAKPVQPEQLLLSLKRALMFIKHTQQLKENEGIHRVSLDLSMSDGVKTARNQAEFKLVNQVLMDTDFNVHEVARRLGLKRENVYYLMKKYGLERQDSDKVSRLSDEP
ncbi:response regulator [Thiosulfativibrio zosterae]|uniref:Response regulatory domain-containing protein n=1 Tax=Thiosulfativibrio zosterae TaxID=2675053 RepID=A0A6F8PL35_9GAMM|nr:response regulator [Thiosulfativibrio zosterae]BBP42823.1 hypothetical protein THMIRHAT_05690 [Thiosulfativibrio zosterae]